MVTAETYSKSPVAFQGLLREGIRAGYEAPYPHLGTYQGQYVFTTSTGEVYDVPRAQVEAFVSSFVPGIPGGAEAIARGVTMAEIDVQRQAAQEAAIQARNVAYTAAQRGDVSQVRAMGLEQTYSALASGVSRETGQARPASGAEYSQYLAKYAAVSGKETPLAPQFQSKEVVRAQETFYRQTAAAPPPTSRVVSAPATQEAKVGWLMAGTGLPEATIRSQILPKITAQPSSITTSFMTPIPKGGQMMSFAPQKEVVIGPQFTSAYKPEMSYKLEPTAMYLTSAQIGPLKIPMIMTGEQLGKKISGEFTAYEQAKSEAKLQAEAQKALYAPPESGEYGRFIAAHPEYAANLDATRASYLDLARPEFGKRELDIDEKVWGVSKQFESFASGMERPMANAPSALKPLFAPAEGLLKASKGAETYFEKFEPPKDIVGVPIYAGAKGAQMIVSLPNLPASFVRTGGQIGAGLAGQAEYTYRAFEKNDFSKLEPAMTQQRIFFLEQYPKAAVPIIAGTSFLGAGAAVTGIAAAKLPAKIKVVSYEPRPASAEIALEVQKISRVGGKPQEIGLGGIAERPSTPLEGGFRIYAPEAPKIEAAVTAKGVIKTTGEPKVFGIKTKLIEPKETTEYIRSEMFVKQPEKPVMTRTFGENEEMLSAYQVRGTAKTGGFVPMRQPEAYELKGGISETEIANLIKKTDARLEKFGAPFEPPKMPVAPREISFTTGGEKPSMFMTEVTPKIKGIGEYNIAKSLSLEKGRVTEAAARYTDLARMESGKMVLYTGEAQAKGGPKVKITAIVKSEGGLGVEKAMKPEEVFKAIPKPPKLGKFEGITISGAERPLLPELGPSFPKEPFILAGPKEVPKFPEIKTRTAKPIYGEREITQQITQEQAKMSKAAGEAITPQITKIAEQQRTQIKESGISISIGKQTKVASETAKQAYQIGIMSGFANVARRTGQEIKGVETQRQFVAPKGIQITAPSLMPAEAQRFKALQIPKELTPTKEPAIVRGGQIPREIQIPRSILTPREVQVQRQVQIPRAAPPAIPTSIFTPPPPPPRTPPIPPGGGLFIKFPSIGLPPEEGGKAGPKLKGKVGAYIPSFTALQLNIRGAKGRTEATGFGIRPIIGGKRGKK